MRQVTILHDKKQTGDAMYDLCSRYNEDLDYIYIKRPYRKMTPLSTLSLIDYYTYVRNIPYRQDIKPVEVIGRPLQLVKMRSLDCKKKSVLMGSYASYYGIPYHFVASSNRPDRRIHHVYPEIYLGNVWVVCDATYPNYYLGMEKYTTAKEVL